MKLAFVFVGGQKEEWLKELSQDYLKRISFYFKGEIVRIKPSQISRENAAVKLRDESDAILKTLTPQDFVILCDERGRGFTSLKFSQQFVNWCESGKQRLVFIIGGAYGANEELKARANFSLSFSELTLNHHLAQVILLEQVYRAISIWKNLPYHNDGI